MPWIEFCPSILGAVGLGSCPLERINALPSLDGPLPQPLRHMAIRLSTIIPLLRTRYLLQPVEEMHPAQVVEVMTRQRDHFAGDSVEDRIGLSTLFEGMVEGCPAHGTVEVSQPLSPFPDEGTDF